ncbi:hypothetical protein DFJ74DRAFT_159180 [Hyaloraphidium curvatum]|nr:hypothetical protein DFJ74DRAFT_159180 [Hyaloraphidium curvatum]
MRGFVFRTSITGRGRVGARPWPSGGTQLRCSFRPKLARSRARAPRFRFRRLPDMCTRFPNNPWQPTYGWMEAKLKAVLRAAGVTGYKTWHSPRRGGATYAFHCGASVDWIRQVGDWNSDAYRLYIGIRSTRGSFRPGIGASGRRRTSSTRSSLRPRPRCLAGFPLAGLRRPLSHGGASEAQAGPRARHPVALKTAWRLFRSEHYRRNSRENRYR